MTTMSKSEAIIQYQAEIKEIIKASQRQLDAAELLIHNLREKIKQLEGG